VEVIGRRGALAAVEASVGSSEAGDAPLSGEAQVPQKRLESGLSALHRLHFAMHFEIHCNTLTLKSAVKPPDRCSKARIPWC